MGGDSGRAFRWIVTVLNGKRICWGKFPENGLEFSFEDTVACVCEWGGAWGSSGAFSTMVLCDYHIIQAWGHTTVSLGLSRKNSTDEFAAFLHTSQYLRFCKNVLKIGT